MVRDYLFVETITAGEAIARVLAAEGVRRVFGLPGGHVLAIYDALYDAPGIDHILVRHSTRRPAWQRRAPS
jgi:acetolactate synthase-1/2/3 large subunit